MSVKHCRVILEDQKIQTQNWYIPEKFRHLKLGVTKAFFKVKIFHFWFQPHFGKMIAALPRSKQLQKNLGLWSTQQLLQISKTCLVSVVSFLLEFLISLSQQWTVYQIREWMEMISCYLEIWIVFCVSLIIEKGKRNL